MDIPAEPAAISIDWLQAVMAPHLDGATITAVAAENIGEGTGIFGEIVRLRLATTGEHASMSVVVKMPCREPENLAVAQALGLYDREISFFREIAPETPLHVPTCYLAELGDDGGFVLLLEDMSAAFEVGDQVVGATPSQAELAIDALAELHAAWWNDHRLEALRWLPVPNAPEYLATVPGIYRAGLPVLEADWSDRLPPEAIDVARSLEPRFEDLMHRIAEGPPTFSHGDTRLDNIFFARDGSRDVAFIDWQLSLRQRGVTDLSYLIGTSMDTEHSQEHWEHLVRRWHDHVADRGVGDYTWDDCVQHYKEGALYYLVGAMSLIGSFDTGNERGAAMATAYTTRIFNHVVDIDAFTAFAAM